MIKEEGEIELVIGLSLREQAEHELNVLRAFCLSSKPPTEAGPASRSMVWAIKLSWWVEGRESQESIVGRTEDNGEMRARELREKNYASEREKLSRMRVEPRMIHNEIMSEVTM